VRLPLDQNISFRLVERLRDLYPEGVHVKDVALTKADDIAVWEYARANDYVIVSKDDDFRQLSFLHGPPPKAIWVRLGNCTTEDVESLLRDCHAEVVAFVDDPQSAFLILGSGAP